MDGLYLCPDPSTKPSSIILRMMLSTAAFDGAQTRSLGFAFRAMPSATWRLPDCMAAMRRTSS